MNTELVEYELLERRELFGTSDPGAVVATAAEVAGHLARVVEDKGLYTSIRGRKHVRVEGWTLLGSMLGVYPVTVWSRPLMGDDGELRGWEARVEARTLDGRLVGAAESECMYAEDRWRGSDDYAVRSMAQTRATSKALKMPLGFVFGMAGYETTPAEEIPHKPDEPAGEPAEGESITGLRMATDPQMRRLFALFRERGIDDRAERLAFASKVLERPIESARDLTMHEASQLMNAVEAITPPPQDPSEDWA